MKIKSYIYLILFVILASCRTQEKMVNKNLSDLYDIDNDQLAYLLKENSDSLEIIFSVSPPTKPIMTENFNNYKIIYQIKENYTSKETYYTDSLTISNAFSRSERDLIWRFQVPHEYKNKLLIIFLLNRRKNVMHELDIFLQQKNNFYSNYTMYNNGYCSIQKYITPQDSILLTNNRNTKKNNDLYVFRYTDTFYPALPPMIIASAPGKKNLNIDTCFKVSTSEKFSLSHQGMYFIQEDTNTAIGMTLLVKDHKFPRLSKAQELVEPLIYLMTAKEYSNIVKSDNPKVAVDSFWLERGGNKEYSKRLIKSYYENVEYANANFTTFKEGWKTDKGMIHIIFGAPNEVYREQNYEEWIYQDFHNFGAISFIFAKKPNIFSDAHYELVRKKEYEKYWYITVDQWRKGVMIR